MDANDFIKRIQETNPADLINMTTLRVTRIILWAIRAHGLEKTLEDIRATNVMDGKINVLETGVNEKVYTGYLALVELAAKAIVDAVDERGGN